MAVAWHDLAWLFSVSKKLRSREHVFDKMRSLAVIWVVCSRKCIPGTQPHSQLSAHPPWLLCGLVSCDVPGKGLVYLVPKSPRCQDKQQEVSTPGCPLPICTIESENGMIHRCHAWHFARSPWERVFDKTTSYLNELLSCLDLASGPLLCFFPLAPWRTLDSLSHSFCFSMSVKT